jgi:hypothetical protein
MHSTNTHESSANSFVSIGEIGVIREQIFFSIESVESCLVQDSLLRIHVIKILSQAKRRRLNRLQNYPMNN